MPALPSARTTALGSKKYNWANLGDSLRQETESTDVTQEDEEQKAGFDPADGIKEPIL